MPIQRKRFQWQSPTLLCSIVIIVLSRPILIIENDRRTIPVCRIRIEVFPANISCHSRITHTSPTMLKGSWEETRPGILGCFLNAVSFNDDDQ